MYGLLNLNQVHSLGYNFFNRQKVIQDIAHILREGKIHLYPPDWAGASDTRVCAVDAWDIPPVTHKAIPHGLVWKNTELMRREDRLDGLRFEDWRKVGEPRLPGLINPSSFFHAVGVEFMRDRLISAPIRVCDMIELACVETTGFKWENPPPTCSLEDVNTMMVANPWYKPKRVPPASVESWLEGLHWMGENLR
mmetsp:Transcript_506/g.1169  ORF Transcript_506/g.1169 Transcript_506/m.1169 type:complete len:194 (-) Transcript_506:29-610(-)